uniref:Heat-labile enterotoxin IIB, B chain n=1 Tax=Escherichia coli TaxID=562 RepID=UPI0028FC33C1|nr:Chain A, Heat-labile enterotoxin IIB, B chain [Escherichia coli]8H2R_B Chain B, Heat-labile enterotoxin IIB, B chain [Escherichia coli]8H2R_C Chain C, Heat-labile enterotoxin IIB, B chain [Escherichia coli]8H2R_D Chain D, Heat-labile enterotoxin IIB, B chain [Escherichia coli]8H2R_E Chain E, Heat-labile enterotoxin IIB, B chain [Escherichia coli]
KDYPDNVMTAEMRKIAMAAVLSGMRVNMCASPASSPNVIWAIELEAEGSGSGASQFFKDNCNRTTASLVEGVELTKYISDINNNTDGMYVVSSTGGVWRISRA